jgi:2-oxoglutarate dehydrogenase E2 component (dihydrolipoamide succinyltransferase)
MATDIVVPAEQEGTKAVVKTWLKQVGDPVRVNDAVVELETDKVAVEIAASADGVLSEILVAPESEVVPGTVLGRIAEGTVTSVTRAAPKQAAAPRAAAVHGDAELRLSPSVRRLVMEHGLDAGALAGSGRGGRLTRADVEAHLSGAEPEPATRQPGVRRVPHDSMRRRIAEHMSHSLSTAPHVTAIFEADFSAIAAHRAAHKATLDVPLTFTAYFVAASARAMQAAPAVNGRWHDDRVEIHDDVNIGIGIALGDKGLVVPVIPRAQALALFDIARQLHALTEKARAGKLARADVTGGTFSISNHGVSGSLIAAPIIINQPQAAILGVGKLEKRVVVRDDAMVIRPMAYVTLSIDHRMLDGHQTNAWLTRFVEILESWPA